MIVSIDRRTFLPLFALAAMACAKDAGDAQADKRQTVVGARTALVAEQPFRETISAVGAVVPRAGSVALLSAPAPTRVANVFVVAGQAVAKGTPLVEFEQAPFLARAQSADAALQAAERAHDRARRLVDQGISARKDLEQAATELARVRAEAVAARREAQLSRLESPIAGVVTKMTAVLGASVDANQPLVEVADPAAVDVVVTVAPAEASRVHVGALVIVSSGQGMSAQRVGSLTVSEVGGTVDADTRGVAIRIRGGSLNRQLRIGESVTAEITVAEFQKAPTVPLEALVPGGEGFKVFVVDAQDIAHERAVVVGGRTTTVAHIIDGLKAGERVVTYGAFGVSDSARVAPPGHEQDVAQQDAKAATGKKP